MTESWVTWQPWDKSLKGTLVAAQEVALEEQGYETIEEALEATGDEGTASVVDISGFSEEAEEAQCWELTGEECAEHLGSQKPSREVIEEKIGKIVEGLSRGEAVCVIAWKKDKPEGVVFAGPTAD